jgi:hypothetical protein
VRIRSKIVLMKRQTLLSVFVALVVFLAASPAQAVWRSDQGNIFQFYNNFTYVVYYTNGATATGTWYWNTNGSQFTYTSSNGKVTRRVTIHGNTATTTNYYGTEPGTLYWIADRGAESEDDKPFDGWFMLADSVPKPKQ